MSDQSKTDSEPEYELEKEVFYALTSDEDATAQRTAKLVALLVGHFHKNGDLIRSDIDKLLTEALR